MERSGSRHNLQQRRGGSGSDSEDDHARTEVHSGQSSVILLSPNVKPVLQERVGASLRCRMLLYAERAVRALPLDVHDGFVSARADAQREEQCTRDVAFDFLCADHTLESLPRRGSFMVDEDEGDLHRAFFPSMGVSNPGTNNGLIAGAGAPMARGWSFSAADVDDDTSNHSTASQSSLFSRSSSSAHYTVTGNTNQTQQASSLSSSFSPFGSVGGSQSRSMIAGGGGGARTNSMSGWVNGAAADSTILRAVIPMRHPDAQDTSMSTVVACEADLFDQLNGWMRMSWPAFAAGYLDFHPERTGTNVLKLWITALCLRCGLSLDSNVPQRSMHHPWVSDWCDAFRRDGHSSMYHALHSMMQFWSQFQALRTTTTTTILRLGGAQGMATCVSSRGIVLCVVCQSQALFAHDTDAERVVYDTEGNVVFVHVLPPCCRRMSEFERTVCACLARHLNLEEWISALDTFNAYVSAVWPAPNSSMSGRPTPSQSHLVFTLASDPQDGKHVCVDRHVKVALQSLEPIRALHF